MHIPIPDGKELQQALSLAVTPEHFATGGFKAVFRAQIGENQTEALKAVYIPHAEDEESKLQRDQLVARATREIVSLKECRFPEIVKLGSIEAKMMKIGGHRYLVYSEEMLPGAPLNTWLEPTAKQASIGDLGTLFMMLIDLIENLSALNYLHRDIKPHNIMDTGLEGRRFVILDMGIAYKIQGTNITQGPNPPGTLRYMAPELLSPNYKDSMDFRSELYSAGLTVHAIASKHHPFSIRPEAVYATIHRIMHERPQPLEQLRQDLPVDFCRIIDRCIRKKAALRYSNLSHLKDDIRKAIS